MWGFMMQYGSMYSYSAITNDSSLMTLRVIAAAHFHMFGCGLLPGGECVSARNEILRIPLLITEPTTQDWFEKKVPSNPIVYAIYKIESVWRARVR